MQFIKQKSAELLRIRIIAKVFGKCLLALASIDVKLRNTGRSASKRLTKTLFGLDDKDFKPIRKPQSRKRSKKLTLTIQN